MSAPMDYLVKDYASFRRLILDRLALAMPNWQERNPADVGMVLAELLAHAADTLSYYQDAVATEAYLGTARKRVSVRRHARLLDYAMHEGCNARAWVCFEVGQDIEIPSGTRLLMADRTDQDTNSQIVFETMYKLSARAARNGIALASGNGTDGWLQAGAISATLRIDKDPVLQPGDILILEEALGPESGKAADADPTHRHAVRLKSVGEARNGQIAISWYDDDALPFALCVCQFNGASASVARANVVLADHGRTISGGTLEPPQAPDVGRYRPRLPQINLTYAVPYDDTGARMLPAAAALQQDPRYAVPVVILNKETEEEWSPRPDLLSSDPDARHFVVEMDEDRRATLRFGDDVMGKTPVPATAFAATYRVGNGTAGNVGAETLTRLEGKVDGILRVWNPLPATGGADPEPIEQVRLYAPTAFRTQERAVTEADYAVMAERHPEVQKAVASICWTGSWYTVCVTVDRKGGKPVDDDFKQDIMAYLVPYRMAGYDVQVDGPCFVPLDIAMTVYLKPGYLRDSVRQVLLDVFSNQALSDGRRGFFHPDNLTFGQPIYLSQVIATAMQVPGVAWIDMDDALPKRNCFRRWGETGHVALESGRIEMGRLEIARVDNDPRLPEDGRIEFTMEGGL